MDLIEAKNILAKVQYGDLWYGIDYNMNLYKGCSHGCIYCDSRSNCYHIENFDVVKGKKDALAILEKELRGKRKKGVIGIGAMSDTYNPQETKYELTRGALSLINKYGFGVSIDTKSDLILRDLDLLNKINKNNNVIVKFTITTPKDEISKKIEPRVCVSSKRLEAIKKLSDNGIFVGIMMNPTLPFISDNIKDIKDLVYLAYKNGAKFIHTYLSVTLRENQRDYYYKMLDKYYPELKEKYIRIYKNNYECKIQNYKEIYSIFENECKKYGILYKMEDIIKAYKKQGSNDMQVNMFDLI